MTCVLTVVGVESRETPEVSQLPAVTTVEALSAAVLSAWERHLATLEVLERAQVGAEGEAV
ncbi:hypothetical protein IWQ52_004151 [Labrenzia sp. EL_159]|nr:hypothetical protein [Labrenzia sp. EL_162]MBG6196615.1 hypothetical protein [Labrenzia sp. EL_159]